MDDLVELPGRLAGFSEPLVLLPGPPQGWGQDVVELPGRPQGFMETLTVLPSPPLGWEEAEARTETRAQAREARKAMLASWLREIEEQGERKAALSPPFSLLSTLIVGLSLSGSSVAPGTLAGPSQCACLFFCLQTSKIVQTVCLSKKSAMTTRNGIGES